MSIAVIDCTVVVMATVVKFLSLGKKWGYGDVHLRSYLISLLFITF